MAGALHGAAGHALKTNYGPARLNQIAPAAIRMMYEVIAPRLTPIGTIEVKTGLDFFPDLEEAVETVLEAAEHDELWEE